MTSEKNNECKSETFPTFPIPPMKDKIQVSTLLTIKKIEQRTPEWFLARETMITASDWATALGEGHFGNKNDFILKKCGKGPTFKGNIYTEWGVKYEPIATRLYELRNKIKLEIIFKGMLIAGESNLVGAWMAARGGARFHLQFK